MFSRVVDRRHAALVGLLTLVFTQGVAVQGTHDLLRRVAENYKNLKSFEVVGHLTATIPDSELRIWVEALDAMASRDFAPPGSTILRYGEARSFRGV